MQTSGCNIQLQSRNPLIATATFSPDFPAFAGHFPTNAGGPILPGFLHIQLALEVLQLAGLSADLLETQNAKFLAPILPNTEVRVEITPDANAPDFAVTLIVPAQIVSRFHLRLTSKKS